MKNKRVTLILFLLISNSINLFSQINKVQLQRIDSIFASWNTPNHPGGSVGIMQNGEVIFAKGYGLASMEYLVPNSPSTLFNLASVSKQFTAMGIVLLKNQGKLSFDDDIRKYIPDLPDFKDTIRIRHLFHHTSGMRSFHDMLELAGWRSNDARSNEDLRRFMKKQQYLNFKPGEKFLYCNNGYIFMADIIEKITNESFVSWMQKSIFKPLGMDNSYVEDVYNHIVPNNATSYYDQSGKGFLRAVEYWGYIGSGNMHSNIYDLFKWLNNFHSPQKGWEGTFSEMQTRGILNNRDTISYAYGIIVDKDKGKKRISHSGSIGGFRTAICTYPDEKLNIVILTNFSSSSPSSKLEMISDILLGKKEVGLKSIAKPATLPADELQKVCDFYWNEDESYSRKIYNRNDTLMYQSSEKNETRLLPVTSTEFLMANEANDTRVLFSNQKQDQKRILVITKNDTAKLESYTPLVPSARMLNAYTGEYYSSELMTFYNLLVVDGKLVAYHPRHGEMKIKILRENNLEGDILEKIRIKRDRKGNILGFYVSNSRAKNVWFEKIKK